jgi:hypothetical protein
VCEEGSSHDQHWNRGRFAIPIVVLSFDMVFGYRCGLLGVLSTRT